MEQQDGWVLATFLQRLIAFLIDAVLTNLPTLVGVVALVFAVIVGTDNGSPFLILLTTALASLAILFGYFVWWLFALRRGQTPGKQVVGIRVIRTTARHQTGAIRSCASLSSSSWWVAFFPA